MNHIKFLLFLSLFLISCEFDKDSIDETLSDGDFDSIKEFIINNLYSSEPETRELLTYAVIRSMSYYPIELINFFEPIFYDEKSDSDLAFLKIVFINTMQANGKRFENPSKIISFYCNRLIQPSPDTLKSTEVMVKLIIQNYHQEQVNTLFNKEVIKSIKSGDISKAGNIFNVYKDFKVRIDTSLVYAKNIIQKIVAIENNNFKNVPEIDSIDLEIWNINNFYNSQITSIENEINSINSTYEKVNEEITDSEFLLKNLGERADNYDYFYLHGYIVGVLSKSYSSQTYEIITGERYRAHLKTYETTFSNQGYFSLLVRKSGTVNVELKKEYGSFDQVWTKYEEVSESDINTYRDIMAEISLTKSKINKLSKEAETIHKKHRLFAHNKDKVERLRKNTLRNKYNSRYQLIEKIKKQKPELDDQLKFVTVQLRNNNTDVGL